MLPAGEQVGGWAHGGNGMREGTGVLPIACPANGESAKCVATSSRTVQACACTL